MPATCVVGLQWGDEAKGKITDILSDSHDCVVRYNGGANAGHTVVWGERKFALSLLPTGVLKPHVTSVIGNGVVVYPPRFLEEVEKLRTAGVAVGANLVVSDCAHVILPYHRLQDELEEGRRGAEKLGTTGRGIGPVYADKAARIGIRMGELVDATRFAARLTSVLEEKNALISAVYGHAPLDAKQIIAEYSGYADALRPYVQDTSGLVYRAACGERGVIFEGAQGTLLDLDLGTYPFVTSSHPIAGGACLGTGVGPTMIDGVIGVAKSYTTRVGAGVFPTELLNGTGDYIRERGHEYGTTTGRPRRCGWLDTVILRYAVQVNGLSCLSLGHVDVLSGLDDVNICVAYTDGNGQRLEDLPSELPIRLDIAPVYETLQGWTEELDHVRAWEDLPLNARRFVERVQELVGVPVATLSVGPAREQTILLNEDLARHGTRTNR